MEEYAACSMPSLNCKSIDPYYIFEHIDEFDIREIAIDYTTSLTGIKVKFNDKDNPVTYTNGAFAEAMLSITKDYYEKHRDLIDKLVVEICKKTRSDEISLHNTALIDEKKINAISSNSNIQNVILGNKDDVFSLDMTTYSKLKESGIKSIETLAVCPELENNFDSIISFNSNKRLVGYYDYNTLSTTSSLNISDSLTPKELENLKYLNSKATIKINFSQGAQFIEIIKRLKESNPVRTIIIKVENKNEFNAAIFQHLNEINNIQNITISVSDAPNPIDLLTYIKYEKELISMITPAIGLSPFEKYLYAYNIAKQFKEYQESPDNRSDSRNLYQVLDNNYIVCAGFSHLLGDLLDKLNIENNYYSVRVETGYDGLKPDITILPNEITNKKTGEKREIKPRPGGHARREIHLADPKYEIDGYFIADPTWDNEMGHDSYLHALMTHDEYVGLKRYNYMNTKDVQELFFVHSIEEFYQKLNILLDKNPDKKLDFFITEMMKHLSKLDKEFYKLLADKYQIKPNVTVKLPFEIQQEILSDIGTHILNKTNNIVNGEQFRQAITTIYNLIYDASYIDIDALVEETMNYNKEEYDKSFPKLYKIDKEGNRTIELNEHNKFSTEEPENKISL